MITGEIRERFPRSKLRLPGRPNAFTVEFIVDTGFDGEMSLPYEDASRLRSENPGKVLAEMANGQFVEVDYCEIVLDWDDEPRRTQVLIMDGAPLIGVVLLGGLRLTVDFVPRGDVSTEPL